MSGSILGSAAPEAIEIGRSFAGQSIRTNKGHILLFGGTGAGKGTRILMPNLLEMRGRRSIFVIDPKAELAAVTAAWRRTVSRVVILNPFGVLTQFDGYEDLRGVGFNPLASLDPDSDDFERDAGLLAEAMITISADSKDKHWDESACGLLAAIIMYVVLIARQNGIIPTMERVRELLGSASEAPSRRFPEGKGIPKLARVMMRAGRPALRNLAAQFSEWHDEIKSIRSNALRQTKCFDTPQLRRNMARNDFDFADLKREPTTVYLILPPHELEEHGKWLRLLITSALRSSMRPRQIESGEPNILFMFDEFAALGHLKIIETTWTQVRGYGIQMMAVFQDLLQLKDIYKDRWGSFLANAGAMLFFRPNDPTTAEWLSKRLGETTRMLQTMNESQNQSGGRNTGRSLNDRGGEGQSLGSSNGWSSARSINTSPVKVPLTLPHELYGLQDGEMRAFLTGVKDGLTLEAVSYFEIENRDRRARRNPYVHPVPRRQTFPPSANAGDALLFGDGSRRDPSPAPRRQNPPLPPPEYWGDFENGRF